MSERSQLINLAYRFLGSLADAEDVVHETYAAGTRCPNNNRKPSNPPAAG